MSRTFRSSRREYLKGTLGAAASAGWAAGATDKAGFPRGPQRRSFNAAKAEIQLSEIFSPGESSRLKLAKQMGMNYAIVGVSGVLGKARREDYVSVLQKVKDEFAAAGLKIAGVESHPVNAEKIKLGVAGRDEEIENYKAAIDALAHIGVRMICYNFMAGLGWYRTRVDLPERGGALTSEFDWAVAQAQGPTQFGEVSVEKMWANMEYFQKAVIPHAEKAGVNMALHPDDPPLTPLRGIGRILISGDNFRRVLAMVPSKVNGVTFCQANFKAMGEDIEALAKEWLNQKKIFFIHYRDIAGTPEKFRETFHDNGPTDMVRMMRVYAEGGFRGPIRPDHAPTMEGEENDRPGYAMKGKIFATGYMKGILDTLGVAAG
jgi:mannonate dehydratase